MTAAKKTTKKAAAKKAAAKPRLRSERPALVDKICARLECGESLNKACIAEGTTNPTFLRWVAEDPALAEKYTRAREAGLHLMAEQIIEISDEKEVEARYDGEDVKIELSSAAVARNRLRVDARKWLLSKMLPRVYGERVTQEHTGSVEIVTKEQRDAAVRAALGADD